MELVDAKMFQKIKYIQERGDKKSDNFGTSILEEGSIEKALNVWNKIIDEKRMENNI